MRTLSTQEMVAVSGGGLGSWLKSKKNAILVGAGVVTVAGTVLVATGVGAPIGGGLILVGVAAGAGASQL